MHLQIAFSVYIEYLCASGRCLNRAFFGSSMSSDQVKEQQKMKAEKLSMFTYLVIHLKYMCNVVMRALDGAIELFKNC